MLLKIYLTPLSQTQPLQKEKKKSRKKKKLKKQKNTAKKYNKGGSFSTLKLPKSFGVIPCERDDHMLESFIKAYGTGPYKTFYVPFKCCWIQFNFRFQRNR